jgi:hypothetical protein
MCSLILLQVYFMQGIHKNACVIILQGTVKSGNFVTFFAQNIFFHKISWRYPIFFLAVNSFKKWFRCWHGHFLPWPTSKPLFFYSSSGDEIALLEGNFVSHLYPWTKTWIWTPAGNFFSWKFFVKNLGTHTKWYCRCLAQVSSPNLDQDMGQGIRPSNFLKKWRIRDKKGV